MSLSLTACSSMDANRVLCPKTAILAEFSKSIDFPQGIPIRTEIDSLIPHCTLDVNQTIIDLRLRITSFRQLTHFHHPLTLKLSYFVAVIDKTGKLLSRSNHNLNVVFEENQTTKVNFEHLRETVPAEKDATIYVGFNLDDGQVEFLRKEREKIVHDYRH